MYKRQGQARDGLREGDVRSARAKSGTAGSGSTSTKGVIASARASGAKAEPSGGCVPTGVAVASKNARGPGQGRGAAGGDGGCHRRSDEGKNGPKASAVGIAGNGAEDVYKRQNR